jgi:hypothetical protein
MKAKETLEEAANRLFYTVGNEGISSIDSFMKGASYQAERMYSEEEAVQLLIKFNQEIQEVEDVREWFKQFKKK